jgi:hypothetical protein
METKEKALTAEQKEVPGTDRTEREEEQRRKGNRISQGPLRKYRKLQGPDCKTKFPVDLKPE